MSFDIAPRFLPAHPWFMWLIPNYN